MSQHAQGAGQIFFVRAVGRGDDGEQGFGMGVLKLLAGDAVVMGGRGCAADVTLADVWLLGGELEF
ncbi:hypothetical protein NEIMUCOT_03651 [Neisseria mucosa ATCC 25996]|uniref:Uncharacterized protein n=1 Tax=Neisseria mucosa (strain ATCC 25996 / DSM 4631 / NCTC 10774 / M26) TaxID=546266 RepID=D2ZSS0_NEIM2|nr:hypothetical protein NEIMUCOT_03651 [Neisseria mucosa ATCC 25996]